MSRALGRVLQSKDWGIAVIIVLAAATIIISVADITAEPGQGALLAVSPQEDNLLQITYPRGRALPLFPLGFPAAAAAVDVNTQDATTDVAFLGRGMSGSTIHRADLQSFVVSLVGDTGLGSTSVHGMDYMSLDATTDAYSFPATDSAGQPQAGILYAALNLQGDAASGGDYLAIIDRVSGAATAVGPFGLDGVEALAFAADGTLWAGVGAHSASTPGLYTVDTEHGWATFYATLDNAGSNGPPGSPSGGLTALTFGCDGTLWGGSGEAVRQASLGDDPASGIIGSGVGGLNEGIGRGNNLSAGRQRDDPRDLGDPEANDGGRLLSIDAGTGYFNYAPRQTVRRGGLGGLAFDRPCLTLFAPVPGLADSVNELLSVGGSPGGPQQIFVGFSAGASGVFVPGCGNLTLDIQDASLRGRAVADGSGEATFDMFLPRGFGGRKLFFQVVDRDTCELSNLGALTLP